MNIILVMVSSADGKTTHPGNHGWSSVEDQEHFNRLKSTYPVIIMGRKTYDAVRKRLRLSPTHRRIVMTKQPDRYIGERVTGQLEFTDDTPRDLIGRLSAGHIDTALLVGGSEINGAFLALRSISECYLTIEPRFFGNGKSIFTSDAVDVSLQLLDSEILNSQGTIVLHYRVIYEHTDRQNG